MLFSDLNNMPKVVSKYTVGQHQIWLEIVPQKWGGLNHKFMISKKWNQLIHQATGEWKFIKTAPTGAAFLPNILTKN